MTRKNYNNEKVKCAELEEARKEKQEAKRKYSGALDEIQKQAHKPSLIEKNKEINRSSNTSKS